jgi:hypothetical protein
MAGIVYRKPAPGEPPFVKEGDRVAVGQSICIIEVRVPCFDCGAVHVNVCMCQTFTALLQLLLQFMTLQRLV